MLTHAGALVQDFLEQVRGVLRTYRDKLQERTQHHMGCVCCCHKPHIAVNALQRHQHLHAATLQSVQTPQLALQLSELGIHSMLLRLD